MKIRNNKRVLISGASFAGLSTAYWMNRMGYEVTIIEVAKQLKKGGTPVNILGDTIGIVKRMGLYHEIQANKITMELVKFKNGNDVTMRQDFIQKSHEAKGETEFEIERDVLLHLLHDVVKDNVTFVFGDSVTALQEEGEGMSVTFKSGRQETFDLVFGCDGIHSAVRRLWFGEEAEFSHFLKAYFSITIVHKLLIPENTIQLYAEPGKSVMLNAYNGKTDIVLTFYSEEELPYDYRNEEEQRSIILSRYQGMGWRVPELLDEVTKSGTFYFDKLCQMKMPNWTKGCVALVGDAGYCASPAAGRGGSLAIDGASALADAFEQCGGDYAAAFAEYNKSFRPFIDGVQAEVVEYGVEVLIPRTQEVIEKRYREGFGF